MTVTRAPAPELQIIGPPCPVCTEEVASDGSYYWCENCDISWNLDGSGATWSEAEADQCPWLYDHSDDDGEVRCILAAGHDSVWHIDGDGWAWLESNQRAHLPVVDDDPSDGKWSKVIGACIVAAGTWAMLHQELAHLFGGA